MIELAEIAYNAYGNSVQWKAYNGEGMPGWAVLPQRIKVAWCASAAIIREEVLTQ